MKKGFTLNSSLPLVLDVIYLVQQYRLSPVAYNKTKQRPTAPESWKLKPKKTYIPKTVTSTSPFLNNGHFWTASAKQHLSQTHADIDNY